MRIKLFADGADKKGILEMYENPQIDGFTTNPTLMKKAGVKNYSNFAKDILKRIKNAGAVFMGRNTPEALGDYLAGPSHVLPTSRSAKFSSGLSVFDFLKKISLVEFSKEGIEQVGDSAIKIADNEGLDGHSRSIEYRLTKK